MRFWGCNQLHVRWRRGTNRPTVSRSMKYVAFSRSLTFSKSRVFLRLLTFLKSLNFPKSLTFPKSQAFPRSLTFSRSLAFPRSLTFSKSQPRPRTRFTGWTVVLVHNEFCPTDFQNLITIQEITVIYFLIACIHLVCDERSRFLTLLSVIPLFSRVLEAESDIRFSKG